MFRSIKRFALGFFHLIWGSKNHEIVASTYLSTLFLDELTYIVNCPVHHSRALALGTVFECYSILTSTLCFPEDVLSPRITQHHFQFLGNPPPPLSGHNLWGLVSIQSSLSLKCLGEVSPFKSTIGPNNARIKRHFPKIPECGWDQSSRESSDRRECNRDHLESWSSIPK